VPKELISKRLPATKFVLMKKGVRKGSARPRERGTMAETREAIARAAKRLDGGQDNFATRRLVFGRRKNSKEVKIS
jgi:hypothetical protein